MFRIFLAVRSPSCLAFCYARRFVHSSSPTFNQSEHQHVDALRKQRREFETELNRRHFEKYSHKLKEVGVESHDILKQKVSEIKSIEEQQEQFLRGRDEKKDNDNEPLDAVEKQDETKQQKINHPKMYAPKGLQDLIHMDKIQNRTAEEISQIWTTFLQEKSSLSAIIPNETYSKLKERMTKYPMFVLPLGRDEGSEFFLTQCFGDKHLFTSLLEYQLHKDTAPTYLINHHFTELSDSKGIVLIYGNILSSNIQLQQAQQLAHLLQYFYLVDNNFEIVKSFHENPQDFDFNRILAALP